MHPDRRTAQLAVQATFVCGHPGGHRIGIDKLGTKTAAAACRCNAAGQYKRIGGSVPLTLPDEEEQQ